MSPMTVSFMDAVFLELQIQIRVGKSTGTPMLEGSDVARLRFQLAPDLATPPAVFEALARPCYLLNQRNVLPSLVVTRTVSTMQRIEDAQLRPSAPRSGFATYAEHNDLLLQQSSSGPILCLPRK